MANIIITIICIFSQALQERSGIKIMSIALSIFLIMGLIGQGIG